MSTPDDSSFPHVTPQNEMKNKIPPIDEIRITQPTEEQRENPDYFAQDDAIKEAARMLDAERILLLETSLATLIFDATRYSRKLTPMGVDRATLVRSVLKAQRVLDGDVT